MVYNFKEYIAIFDTPAKKQQELAVSRKIMSLLNNNKYETLETFIAMNATYKDFLQKNNFYNAVKHFGNTLNEQDYAQILENIRKLTNQKEQFNNENIKTTNIGNNEYISYKGEKDYFLDNTNSTKTIEEQMKDLQGTSEKFQSSNPEKNTEEMFSELEANKKQSLNLIKFEEIKLDELNEKEKKIYDCIKNFVNSSNKKIRVDLGRQLIVDEDNEILKIYIDNDEYKIVSNENEVENSNEVKKTYQKSLSMNPNVLYLNN